MSQVTMTSVKSKDHEQGNPKFVGAGETLSIGDVVVVDSSDVANKLDVSDYSGDGSDITICLTDSASGDSVGVAEDGTDLTGVSLSEGDVLYAMGVGNVGDAWSDVVSGDDVVILGARGVGGVFRFKVQHMGYEKT